MDNDKEQKDELGPEEQKLFLDSIQSSYLKNFGGKYTVSRLLRRYHRTFSPKALAHKKSQRQMARSSRQFNRRRANGK